MASFGNMTLQIRSTIEEIGPAKFARAAGFPLSTVFRWMQEDRIPGRGAAHDMRLQKFEEAVKTIRAGKAPSNKKRVRTAA